MDRSKEFVTLTMQSKEYSRREYMKLSGLGALGVVLSAGWSSPEFQESMITRTIHSSSEAIPVIGLGTWRTFDVGRSKEQRTNLTQVLETIHQKGGSVIDSSPMYGSSEKVVGELTQNSGLADHFFYATKVWTRGEEAGIDQMNRSFRLMQRNQLDLIQIHNLIDWQTHVKTLKKWKDQGKIKYWGITHYLDASHDELEKVIKQEKPDFVQVNYSIRKRHAEKSLFDTIERFKTAVLINRPYEGGTLFQLTKGKELPDWCSEFDIASWGQFFLKFILSNPLVSCVIPGTSKPTHALDNMMAGYGKLPDQKTRERMYQYIRSL